MSKHHHEAGDALQQRKRFFVRLWSRCFVRMRVRQPLTYATTLFTLAILLFASIFFVRVGAAWARPMRATAPGLGTAASFAVLAASAVTNAGPAGTVVTGDLGVSPSNTVTGFPPGTVVDGTIHAGDAVAVQAQADALVAYNDLAGQACNTDLTGQELGGLTLTPAVYCFSSSAQLSSILTLDGLGDPSAVFIFQIGSTFTTASGSSVRLTNGANACNIFWQVGSSATLGTSTLFNGSILARASNTLTTGASVTGRVIALTAAVTMDSNAVTRCIIPPTPTPIPPTPIPPTPIPPTPIPPTPIPPTPIPPTPIPPTPIPPTPIPPTPIPPTPIPPTPIPPTPIPPTPIPARK